MKIQFQETLIQIRSISAQRCVPTNSFGQWGTIELWLRLTVVAFWLQERGAEKERRLITELMQKQFEEERARVPKANPYPYTTDYPVVQKLNSISFQFQFQLHK